MARLTRNIDPSARLYCAFTLAESLIASVVLAIAVVAVSEAIVSSQQQTTFSEDDSLAVAMAKQLMEQTASLPLTLPDGTAGWPTVTNTSSYDTINDFNGYTDKVSDAVYRSNQLSAAGTFSSAGLTVTPLTSGAVTPAAGEYVRTVSVTYPTSIYGKSVLSGDFSSGDFAIVTVNVKGSAGTSVTISRILAKTTVSR